MYVTHKQSITVLFLSLMLLGLTVPVALAQPAQENDTQNPAERAAQLSDDNPAAAAEALGNQSENNPLRTDGLVQLLQAILLELHAQDDRLTDLEERVELLEEEMNMTNQTVNDTNATFNGTNQSLNQTNETLNQTNQTNESLNQTNQTNQSPSQTGGGLFDGFLPF